MKLLFCIIIVMIGCRAQQPIREEPEKETAKEAALLQRAKKNIAEAKKVLEKATPLCKKTLAGGYAGYTEEQRELEGKLAKYDFASFASDELRKECEEHFLRCERGAGQLEAFLSFRKIFDELKQTLGKALTLCLEMESRHLIVRNKRLLEEIGAIAQPHEMSTSPSPMEKVQSHRKDCEEEYAIFKILVPKEYENWRKMHAAFCQFHTWELPADSRVNMEKFLIEDAEAFSMLLNHKKYPTSSPGCISKRVEAVVDHLCLYQRYGVEACTREQVEGEWLLFHEGVVATEATMERLDPLVTEVLRQVRAEAL